MELKMNMTLEYLEKAADELGYRLVKKEPDPNTELIYHCGIKPHIWYWHGAGWYYECPICGAKTEPEPLQRVAIRKWNELVQREIRDAD